MVSDDVVGGYLAILATHKRGGLDVLAELALSDRERGARLRPREVPLRLREHLHGALIAVRVGRVRPPNQDRPGELRDALRIGDPSERVAGIAAAVEVLNEHHGQVAVSGKLADR